MAVYDTVELAIRALERAVIDTSIKDISKNIEIALTDAIKDTVYSNPSDYDRTNSFFNSVDSEVNYDTSGVDIISMTNPLKMNPSHTSWATGEDVDDNMTSWLNDGHDKGLARYDYPAQHFIEESQNIVNTNAKLWLKKGLEKRGFDMI